ncbi:MAG: UbiA family prenyltransferase [Thermoplasmatota archaeon]
MNIKINGYIALLRPFTLLAPLIVSSSIMITSLIYAGAVNLNMYQIIATIIPASLCFALLNGASNALNQATDFTEDKYSKPYRPIPKGVISQKQAFNLSFSLYITALLLSVLINIAFSFLILLIAFFSITYSLPPRTKKYLIINQLCVAISRGFLGIIGSWAVFANPIESLPLAIGIISALFLFGGTSTKDILDSNADKKAGTKTLVNVFGLTKTSYFSLFFMGFAFLLIIPLSMFHIIEIFFLPLSLLSILSFFVYWLMTHSHKNEKYENTSAWTLMYATYFIFALSFTTLTIFFS